MTAAHHDRELESWQWVRAAQGGDREAFGWLYQRYLPQVHRFVRRRIPDAGLAEDLTGETFLRALRRIDTLTERRGDPGAWLTTIARNLVLDHRKSARTQRDWVTDEIPEPRAGAHTELGVPERAQARADRAAAAVTVARCLAELTPDQRRAVQLYDLAPERRAASVATVMDRSEAAVKALRRRALQAMREQLSGEGLTCPQDCLDAAQQPPRRGDRAVGANRGNAVEHAADGPAAKAEVGRTRAEWDSVSVERTAVAVRRASEAVTRLRAHRALAPDTEETARAEREARWHTDDHTARDADSVRHGWALASDGSSR